MYLFCFDSNLYNLYFYIDDFSFSMVFLSMWLLMLILSINFNSLLKSFFIVYSFLVVLLFFCVSSMIMFFIFFELMLVPLFSFIIFFGNQPERLKAGRWMMMYTLVGSVPFLISLCYLYGNCINNFGLVPVFFSLGGSPFIDHEVYLFFIMGFLIKIPLFLTHSWLPKAHVEAPLEGSMILAGIMLKVGVFGMVRFFVMIPGFFKSNLSFILFCLGLFGCMAVSFFSIMSDDMKMSVAYSSVSHMNFLICGLLSMKFMGIKSCLIIMISHGLCSCLLFLIVTFIYMKVGSRSLLMSKGFFSIYPLGMFINFISWVMNMSVPPFFSFLGELMCFGSSLSVFPMSIFFMLLYILFNSFFSLLNYGYHSHSMSFPLSNVSGFPISFMILSFMLAFPLLFLFFFDFLFLM
uniref:NADH dehydrogenase subunit 4 n=1 Tax=Falcolipeurus marginalis TaxID=236517 RepID=UPI00211EF24B|nr:NADH dehydrogenase subunit 4 [Falcolipeurus marginalis]UTT72595.1 NADH dehydrogenase subunit 4 [Falcolipeurus marginalis]